MNDTVNFLDAYTDYCSEITDAPPSMHYRIGFSIISAILNRKVWISGGHKKIYPNIWQVVVAPSSFYRKSYSLGIAQSLIREIDPLLILPDDFTREQMISILQKHPARILFSYEFRSFMNLMQREYNSGMQSILTELYDCPQVWQRETKTTIEEIENPCLSILSATTLNWFEDSMKDSDLAGGFLPRFLINVPPKDRGKLRAWQPPHNHEKRAQLISILQSMTLLEGEMTVSKDSYNHYESWFQSYIESNNEKFPHQSAFFTRLAEYAKKLSIIFAVNNHCDSNKMSIELSDMKRACYFAQYFTDFIINSIYSNLAFTPYQKNRRKVTDSIPEHPNSISRSDLSRTIRISGYELENILKDLETAEIIEKSHQNGSTKPITFYTRKITN